MLLLKQQHDSHWAQSAPFINLFRLFVSDHWARHSVHVLSALRNDQGVDNAWIAGGSVKSP